MPTPNEESTTGPDAESAGDEAEPTSRETTEEAGESLPREVIDDAERLTRLERNAVDDEEAAAYEAERETLLEDHEYTARVRTEDDDVLVLHPQEWHDEDAGVIRTDRIDDLERAVEIPLEGAGDPDDWEAVDVANRELVDDVRTAHGEVHGDNAALLADFMGNHYAKPIESATAAELSEFRTEYVVRNAWPSDEQRDALERSIELVFETAGEPVPEYRSE
ncbi:DUF7108 family protein [Halostagnicola kamekurae]|uniref:RnhA operon protein n=1 Tax=Halostagnicola kamekurae TaxID=619731 RepID=A0A1I6QB55_9EURY|nr:rnhA operon protein [Halostagnicola kamekurae]SFS49733.1 hypothetical protein SAMN04488556_1144 [Halostagnicola kamekurae]